MKKLIHQFIIYGTYGLLMFVAACSEAPIGQTPVNKTPPSPLSNVEVESLPGGGKFTYDLPKEEDISYVQANYVYKGKNYMVYSSIYNNYLIVEGLGDTQPLEVSLRVVNHSQVASTAVTKSFTPSTPVVEQIYQSIDLMAAFGGVAAFWQNDTQTEIGIRLYVEVNGEWQEQNTVFSKEKEGSFTFRGLDSLENLFAVQVLDKWDNESGLKEKRLTPLVEKLLDKSKFRENWLPNDNSTNSNGRGMSMIWDNNVTTIWVSEYPSTKPFPQSATMDLGVEAIISRCRIWTRQTYMYDDYAWRTFEIWGTSSYRQDMPDEYWSSAPYGGTDAWKNDWILLADCEIKRPSGNTTPINVPTGEDYDAAVRGFDFEVPLGNPSIRYLRFVVKTIWSAGNSIVLAELNVYGDDNL